MSPAQRGRGVVLVALVLGLALGPTAAPSPGRASVDRGTTGAPGAPEAPYPDPPASALVATPPFPVNAHGMTYGSGSDIDEDNRGPDLIAAYGTNGAFGYVRATDRERALRRPTRGLVVGTWPADARDLPLYAQDGVTVVGTFTVGGPTAGR